MSDPVLPADDAARATAKATLAGARHGALGTLDADGAPQVTRVAVLADGPDVLILVSALSLHAAALAADPRASLLLGEPPRKAIPSPARA
ncbi:pyridoxamine 5'-phosphate oxidase family protein [Wenxinia marina]|uniref:Pyridoxamine 5'-phosphate oxidase n=1 Tax=Wenxinia marina DSM 24838 TaxID=1123501 RepID=A0A0D0P7B9_9RHOB|nr:pyridoxamine 5'-phosphate oxidase family protein [Wenxinia marina]KIQ67486.1 Pyridoxamine 5'-phosphate oxidase [Wenxinia marina DSM 24838]GGL69151.1 hypothetical protein GCM10011392_24490 [Wenxinia marina]